VAAGYVEDPPAARPSCWDPNWHHPTNSEWAALAADNVQNPPFRLGVPAGHEVAERREHRAALGAPGRRVAAAGQTFGRPPAASNAELSALPGLHTGCHGLPYGALVAERDRDYTRRPWVATAGVPAAGATIRIDEHTLRYTSAEPSAVATPPTAAAAPARELVCPAGGWRLGEREAAAEAAMGRAGGPWPARYDDGYGRRHGAAAKLGYAH
jgi:hypothetical protein